MNRSFIGQRSLADLKFLFPIDKAADDVTSSFNVGPANEILAIVREAGQNRLDKFHWGLVPFWAKDVSIGKKMINARAGSIATKRDEATGVHHITGPDAVCFRRTVGNVAKEERKRLRLQILYYYHDPGQ